MPLIDRADSAARLLATTGAALAGAGIGALFAGMIGSLAVAVLATGVIAHVIGMVGHRRAQESAGYRYAPWEIVAYWLCWVLIVALVLYLMGNALGTW